VNNAIKILKEDGKIELTVKGKAAHASQPENGKNAITALFRYLGALHTDDVTGSFFASLAELYRYGETNGKTVGIQAEDEKSGALTFVLSKFCFVDGEFSGEFDIRFPICESGASVREKMEKVLSVQGPGLQIETWKAVEPHYTDENSAFVQTLLSVYEEMTNKPGFCISIGGGTYVHEIEGGVAFGAEFLGDDSRMHGADEFMTREKLLLNAKIFAEAILRICE
jgi:succinyl-diaminopimelate desuccinylase